MRKRLFPLWMALSAVLLSLAAPAHADDAAIARQLVGVWKMSDSEKVVLKANGTMTSSDGTYSTKWDVRDGVFHTRHHENEDFYKILSLTKTRFIFQDMYHGRHTGEWTRVAPATGKAKDKQQR